MPSTSPSLRILVRNTNVSFAFLDISFLARLVCFEEDITDEPEPWTWDAMFASVTSEMREEWAKGEQSDEDDSVPHTFGV